MNYPLGFGMRLRIDRYAVAICATPIYASGTRITMLPTMYRGGTVVLLPQFSPRAFLDAVQREHGTHSFLVPTQYIGLLQEKLADWDTTSLKALVTAGQSLPTVLCDALVTNFPGGWSLRGLRHYGGLRDARQRPDLTEAVTWVDPTGRKDMTKSGGINIYAADLEEVVMRYPGVAEAALIGVPHEKWSETPIAVVLLKARPVARPRRIDGLGERAPIEIPASQPGARRDLSPPRDLRRDAEADATRAGARKAPI